MLVELRTKAAHEVNAVRRYIDGVGSAVACATGEQRPLAAVGTTTDYRISAPHIAEALAEVERPAATIRTEVNVYLRDGSRDPRFG